jgi:hypothetical protein
MSDSHITCMYCPTCGELRELEIRNLSAFSNTFAYAYAHLRCDECQMTYAVRTTEDAFILYDGRHDSQIKRLNSHSGEPITTKETSL